MPTKITLPKDYKPSKNEEYMNSMQLEYFKNSLLDWKKELLNESRETLKHLKTENWHEPDMNDRASIENEANLELKVSNRHLKLINKIDNVLTKIHNTINNNLDEGYGYGYCEDTGEPIGIERLIARPIATLSIDAQERHEKKEKVFNMD